MNNATLLYRINNNNEDVSLRLENRPLYLIDKITFSFKDQDDFINHYYNKKEVNDFIKHNGNKKGNLVIEYRKNINDKKSLLPLFNQKESIAFTDDFYNNNFTEIEKSRKLLFNSKNQLFVKLIIDSEIFKIFLNRYIDLSNEEAIFAENNNLNISLINNTNYIKFEELFYYRIKTEKLGYLRNVYQDMVNSIKDGIMKLDRDTFYFYNRELRIILNKYYELVQSISINNLKVYKFKPNKKYNIVKI